MLEAFLITFVGLVAMQIAPGPNLIAVASAALGQNRRAAFMVVLGIATGAVIWVSLVAIGLGVLLQQHPILLTALKLVGGSYLFWLAIRALWNAWRGRDVKLGSAGVQLAAGSAWRRGLLVVLTNPKAALGWAAIASFLFGSGLSSWQVAVFAPIGGLSAVAVYGAYALVFSTGSAVRAYRRFWRAFEIVFGGLFGAMGAKLVVDGVREMRA